METAVLELKETVVESATSTDYVNTSSTETVVVDNESVAFVTLEQHGNILVEYDTSKLIVHGIMGPPGKDGIAEEDMVYSKRIDFVTETELYRGEATVGSSESSAVWRIRKIIIGTDSDVTELWASGSAEFNKSWANRTTYTYS